MLAGVITRRSVAANTGEARRIVVGRTMVSNSFRSIALALVIALVGGFQGRWSSLGRSMLRIGSRDRLEMANAFTSPSVITRQKRDEVMNDPFDSPSALINGGSGTVECEYWLSCFMGIGCVSASFFWISLFVRGD